MMSIGLDPDEAVDNLPTQRDIERSISKLERRLDAVGEVNMLAIEQYERCEERLVQLASDAKHLSWRRTSLIEVTEALESQRSERLVTVLDQVNANFETVYRVLSDGGDASLVLESPEDPFSGGLRMMATPKGNPIVRTFRRSQAVSVASPPWLSSSRYRTTTRVHSTSSMRSTRIWMHTTRRPLPPCVNLVAAPLNSSWSP